MSSLTRFQNPDTIARILREIRTIAVVGQSADLSKPSGYVGAYLQSVGYRIIPINPRAEAILGEKCYPSLAAIPEPVDLVDVFRPTPECLDIARQAVAIKAKALWLQIGLINLEAAELAAAAGLLVVVDRCTKVEHSRFGKG